MILDKRVQKLGYKDYNQYLHSPHWQATKLRFFKSKLIKRNIEELPICEACDRQDLPLHVHHRSYKLLGSEPLRHLALLCELCHSAVHNYLKNNRHVGLWKATAHIIRTTNKFLGHTDAKQLIAKVLIKKSAKDKIRVDKKIARKAARTERRLAAING